MEALKRRPTLEGLPPAVVWKALFHEKSDDILASAVSILNENKHSNQVERVKLFKVTLLSLKAASRIEFKSTSKINQIELAKLDYPRKKFCSLHSALQP